MSNYMEDEKSRGDFMKRKVVIIGGIVLIIGCIVFGVMQLFQKEEQSKENHFVQKNGDLKQNDIEQPVVDNDKDEEEEKEPPISEDVLVQVEVDNSFFDDAVFIGDSRTEGFMIYEDVNATSYTHKGLMVDTIFTSPVITQDGEKITVMEALKNTSFNKVYIMLGINETGWQSSYFFIQKYGEIIDEIKKINPDAIIYVESILPVSEKVSMNHSYIKKAKIDEYNVLIKEMVKEKGVYYLDISSAVANEAGYLPEDAATDGIHLNKKYCDKCVAIQ